jgi:MarR family transcriptional repressor of emrRAB
MHERTANLLGAAALAVSDRLLAGATEAAGTSESGAAALVVLLGAPGLSVTELGRRVGLGQPAAARMVDSLVARQFVERRPGAGKSVAVHPAPDGRAAARRILRARSSRLADLVGRLDEAERSALDGVLGRLLSFAYEDVPSSDRLCRLCDREACVADAECPVGAAERAGT